MRGLQSPISPHIHRATPVSLFNLIVFSADAREMSHFYAVKVERIRQNQRDVGILEVISKRCRCTYTGLVRFEFNCEHRWGKIDNAPHKHQCNGHTAAYAWCMSLQLHKAQWETANLRITWVKSFIWVTVVQYQTFQVGIFLLLTSHRHELEEQNADNETRKTKCWH